MMLFRIEYSIYSIIDFLSGIASFWLNMKWVRKALCVAITDLSVFKKVLTANTRGAQTQAIIVTDRIFKKIVSH